MTTNHFDSIFESNSSSIKPVKSTKSKGDNNDSIKHRTKHRDYFDCLNDDILSINNNNNNNSVLQQDIGDHSHGKHRQDNNNNNIEQWRLIIYILFIVLISFVLYRCSIVVWTKPKKTFLEQFIENFSRFFTF